MKDTNWVLVDTETDGLNQPIHIVEIAAQRMRGWDPVGQPFQVFLNHDVPIPREVVAVHGYTREFLCKRGIDPREAHAEFRSYVDGVPLSAHNLSFDWNRCFDPEWKRLRVKPAGTRGFCTLMLARRLVYELDTHRLERLKECFRLQNEKSHNAFGDVMTLVELVSSVLGPRLEKVGINCFEEIQRFSTRSPVAKCLNLVKTSSTDTLISVTNTTSYRPQKPSTPKRRVPARNVAVVTIISPPSIKLLAPPVKPVAATNKYATTTPPTPAPVKPSVQSRAESARTLSTTQEGIRGQLGELQKVYQKDLAQYRKIQTVVPSKNYVEQWDQAARQLSTRLEKLKSEIAALQKLDQPQSKSRLQNEQKASAPPPIISPSPELPPEIPRQPTMPLAFRLRSGAAEIIPPPNDEVVIGRSDAADRWGPDVDLTPFGGTAEAGVSRRHAKFTWQGKWMIEDMNSANGTYVNGYCLAVGQKSVLANGYVITLGQLQVIFSVLSILPT